MVFFLFFTILLDISARNDYNFTQGPNFPFKFAIGTYKFPIRLKENGKAVKHNRNVYQALMMISQFGINMLVPIFLCSFAGMFLDWKLGTSFWVIVFFFVGAMSGFTNVFKFARKIYETPSATRRRSMKKQSDEKEKE